MLDELAEIVHLRQVAVKLPSVAGQIAVDEQVSELPDRCGHNHGVTPASLVSMAR